MTQPGPGRPGREPRQRMQLTRPPALAAAAALGAAGGWLLTRIWVAVTGDDPQLPWIGPLMLLAIAAFVAVLAHGTRRRVGDPGERLDPQRAVAFLALGKAAALAGAATAGGYLVFALLYLERLDAPTPRDRVVRALVAVVAGAAMSVAGCALERACRVPPGDEDDEDGEDRDDGGYWAEH